MIRHVLPNETDGDTTWFFRQNAFEQQEVLRQVAFKNKEWPELDNGKLANHPEHTYPHILPDNFVQSAFFSPVAQDILDYFTKENISLHTEALNLKSSQVACFNFLFPLRQNLTLSTQIFSSLIPVLSSVDKIEFEYTGPRKATDWLGEPSNGKRGQNRTSIDAVIFWRDEKYRKCATLIEWKYTERNYGVCSAYHSGDAETKLACQSLDVLSNPEPASSCRLAGNSLHCHRHYWEHTAMAGIDLSKFEGLKGCPFRGPFYQIWRQYLLASYLRDCDGFAHVGVVSMSFSQNTALRSVHQQYFSDPALAQEDIGDIWNRALSGVPPMRHIFVEDMMSAVDQASPVDTEWREYLRERYGV